MNFLTVIFCGVLFRLDGKGSDDPTFLPFWPFDNLKGVSLNYARYAIAPIVFAITHNPLHLILYTVAIGVPYGERHWYMKWGVMSWFLYGALLGAASLSWGMSLWLGCVVAIAKKFDIDQSLLEFFVLGMGSTLWLCFIK